MQHWWWSISLRLPFQVSIDLIGGTSLRLAFRPILGLSPKQVVGSISSMRKIILNRAFNYSMSKEAMMIQRITHITKDQNMSSFQLPPPRYSFSLFHLLKVKIFIRISEKEVSRQLILLFVWEVECGIRYVQALILTVYS